MFNHPSLNLRLEQNCPKADAAVKTSSAALGFKSSMMKLKFSRKRHSKWNFYVTWALLHGTTEVFQVDRLKLLLQHKPLKVFPFYFLQLTVVDFDVKTCNIKVFSSQIRFQSVPKHDDAFNLTPQYQTAFLKPFSFFGTASKLCHMIF